MTELTDIREIRRLSDKYGFRFSKSLGQNFLTDGEAVRRTATESAANGVNAVLEIGPGFGVLTRELCRVYSRVAAVELDRSLLPVLAETLEGFGNVSVINADIMKADLTAIIKSSLGGGRVNIAANLPYYITTPVITSMLESGADIGSITVMVQKEVAERLTAQPGSELCGAISCAVAYRAKAVKLFDVPASSFVPSPKVTSSVIRLDMLPFPAVKVSDEKLFFALIKAAFGQRRKQLANAVSNGMPQFDKNAAASAISAAGLPADVRGERLSLEDFASLACNLAAVSGR